ncbi:hypothetical protein ACKFKF_26370 [Phormidesmis sp. 146-12]
MEDLLSDPKKAYEVKLFDRSKCRIKLTEASKAFLSEITIALTHLDQAITRTISQLEVRDRVQAALWAKQHLHS